MMHIKVLPMNTSDERILGQHPIHRLMSRTETFVVGDWVRILVAHQLKKPQRFGRIIACEPAQVLFLTKADGQSILSNPVSPVLCTVKLLDGRQMGFSGYWLRKLFGPKEIAIEAYYAWENRLRNNKNGSAEEDWYGAERSLLSQVKERRS